MMSTVSQGCEPTTCLECERIAREWGATQTHAECSECGAELTRTEQSSKPARVWTVADLELLARWASRFYGRGAGWNINQTETGNTPLVKGETMRVRSSHGGRADHDEREDDRTAEWHRAAAVHRRFEAMRHGKGCTHYAVLWFAVFERGGRSHELGHTLIEEIGRRFASPSQRAQWNTHKRSLLNRTLPRAFGKRLWDGAVKAWEGK